MQEGERAKMNHQTGDSPSQRWRPVGTGSRKMAAHRETTHAKRRRGGPNHNWSRWVEKPQLRGPIERGRVWVKEPTGRPRGPGG